MVVRFWELEADYRVCDCDWLNSMQIMKESSIFLDRTPTTFKLQWRFNFQLLGLASPCRELFFVRREQKWSLRTKKSASFVCSAVRRKLAAKLPGELRALYGAVGAPSDFHLVSSTLSNWYTRSEREREREREREGGGGRRGETCLYCISTEGGAATGSK